MFAPEDMYAESVGAMEKVPIQLAYVKSDADYKLGDEFTIGDDDDYENEDTETAIAVAS